jgi:hypothetical protein
VVSDPNSIGVANLDQAMDPNSLIAGMTSADGSVQ